MFCKHKWKVLSEHVSESISEQQIRLVGSCNTAGNPYGANALAKKIRILTLTCEDCGKLKHFKDEV